VESWNRFNGFRKIRVFLYKPLKWLTAFRVAANPKLKLGENETIFVRSISDTRLLLLLAQTTDVNAGAKDHCEENEHWYEHDETTPYFLQHRTNPFPDVMPSFQ